MIEEPVAPVAVTVRSLGGTWYAYDVNTHAILRLDRLSASLIRHRAWPDRGRNHHKLRARFGASAVDARCVALDELRRTRGLLLSPQVETIRPPVSKEALAPLVARRLSHAVLVVSDHCNLRCRYCCVHSPHYPEFRTDGGGLRMSWAVAKAAIDLLVDSSAEAPDLNVGFYGGEALLERDLIEQCMVYARTRADRRPIHFHLTTNGTALTPAAIEMLLSHDVQLTVSLDGPKTIHDRARVFRNGRGSWARVMAGLDRLRRRDPDYLRRRVTINCVLSRNGDLGAVARFFRSTGHAAAGLDVTLNGVQVNTAGDYPPPDPARPNEDDDLPRLRREFVDAAVAGEPIAGDGILRSLFVGGVYRIHSRRQSAASPRTAAALGQCVPGVKEFAVRPDGSLHVCVNTPRQWPVGDVHTGFDVERVAKVLDGFTTTVASQCRSCWALRLCGLCLSTIGPEMDQARVASSRCREQQAFLREALTMYVSVLERNPQALETMFEANPAAPT